MCMAGVLVLMRRVLVSHRACGEWKRLYILTCRCWSDPSGSFFGASVRMHPIDSEFRCFEHSDSARRFSLESEPQMMCPARPERISSPVLPDSASIVDRLIVSGRFFSPCFRLGLVTVVAVLQHFTATVNHHHTWASSYLLLKYTIYGRISTLGPGRSRATDRVRYLRPSNTILKTGQL